LITDEPDHPAQEGHEATNNHCELDASEYGNPQDDGGQASDHNLQADVHQTKLPTKNPNKKKTAPHNAKQIGQAEARTMAVKIISLTGTSR
jgi:hypothetical protein